MDRVVFPLLQTRVELKGRNFDDPLPVELYNALVRPGDLVIVGVVDLQAPHLDLTLVLLLAEVLVGLQVANQVKLILADIGDVAFSDDLLYLVERVDEPQATVVALNHFFCLELSDGFVQAVKVVSSVADRTEENLLKLLCTFASAVFEKC